MDQNPDPQLPEAKQEPLTQTNETAITDFNRLLLRAQCEEKEGLYRAARDHYIELNRTEEALRCSGKLPILEHDLRRGNQKKIVLLAVTAFICIIAFLFTLISMNDQQRNIAAPQVKWLNPGNVELSGYPSWFLYDQEAKLIKTRAVIDERMKMELEKTFPVQSDSTNFVEFKQAVNKLAFESSEIKGNYFWLLLLVTGLAAVVGVFIREILDLIRHHCYEKDLDFKIWWPWYFLRPLVGFMFGIIVVLFSGTELLFSSADGSGDTYLIAIAIIAGISVEDVMFKIRKVSQVLFGNNNPVSDSDGSSHSSAKIAKSADNKVQAESGKGNTGAGDISEG